MESSNSIVVEAQMLIRKPVAQVFEAFVNPEITNQILVHQEQWPTRAWEKGALGVGDVWPWR